MTISESQRRVAVRCTVLTAQALAALPVAGDLPATNLSRWFSKIRSNSGIRPSNGLSSDAPRGSLRLRASDLLRMISAALVYQDGSAFRTDLAKSYKDLRPPMRFRIALDLAQHAGGRRLHPPPGWRSTTIWPRYCQRGDGGLHRPRRWRYQHDPRHPAGSCRPIHCPWLSPNSSVPSRPFPAYRYRSGWAPGTDQRTWQALRRGRKSSERFPQDVAERALLGPPQENQWLHAILGKMGDTNVPLHIREKFQSVRCAVSRNAGWAALRLRCHLALEQALLQAVEIYRGYLNRRNSVEFLVQMVGCNAIVADTEKRRTIATSP